MKNKKKILALIFIIIILSIPSIVYKKKDKYEQEIKYLASSTNKVTIYQKKDGILKKVKELPRGVKITTNNQNEEIESIQYEQVIINGLNYYIKTENLTNNKEQIVKEKEIYNRTPTYILENIDTGKIIGLAEKTEKF